MSITGTLASFLGGALVGLVFGLSLLAEDASCRRDSVRVVAGLVRWGILAGGLGSLVGA